MNSETTPLVESPAQPSKDNTQPGRATYEQAEPLSDTHRLLRRLDIDETAIGLRTNHEEILTPMLSSGGQWLGLHCGNSSSSRFVDGSRMKGARFTYGSTDGAAIILLASDPMSAHTAHNVSGEPAIACFSEKNMPLVAKEQRRQHPDAKIICLGSRGSVKAFAAARAVRGLVVDVTVDGYEYEHFSDLHRSGEGRAAYKALRDAALVASHPSDTVNDELEFESDKVTVLVEPGEERRVARETVAVFLERDLKIVNYGGSVYWLVEDNNELKLEPSSEERVLAEGSEHINFVRFVRRSSGEIQITITMPRATQKLVNKLPEMGDLEVLKAVVSYPLLDKKGDWHSAEGLVDGLYLNPKGEFIEPGNSSEAAELALERCRQHLRHFEFAEPELHFSAALSMMITAVFRPLLDAAPAGVVDASTQGSGKSKLCQVCAIIATGKMGAAMEYPKDEGEATKRLDSAAIYGHPLLLIDNITRRVDNAALSSIISEATRLVRPLGTSRTLRVPCTQPVFLNGNNIELSKDMARRSIITRLQPKTANPELRVFDQDVIAESIEQRAELIAALQTIVRAYIVAGMPDVGVTPLGGFGEWSKFVASPLVWLGLPNPIQTQAMVSDFDSEQENALTLFRVWHGLIGSKSETSKELLRMCATNSVFKDCVEDFIGHREITSKAIGSSLRGRVGSTIDGYTLCREKVRKETRWYLEHQNGELALRESQTSK